MGHAFRRRAAIVFAALEGASSPACTMSEPAAASVLDTDGDGLSDADELTLHGTSPMLADTDGDGASDRAEIVEHAFDPFHAPYRWNPRVADVPALRVMFAGPPVVVLTMTDARGESRSFDTGRETSSTAGATYGSSRTDGRADSATWGTADGHEVSVTDGADVSVGSSSDVSVTGTLGGGDAADADAGAGGVGGSGGADAGAGGADPGAGGADAGAGGAGGSNEAPSVTVSRGSSVDEGASRSITVTDRVDRASEASSSLEVSFALGAEQSREYAETLSAATSWASSHDVTAVGGELRVVGVVEDVGHLGVQITYILLAATLRAGDAIEPIGNLNVDAPLYSTYPSFSLAPGESSAPLTFIRSGLPLATVHRLLVDATAIDVRLAIFQISDDGAKPFAFQEDDLRAKTAELAIDPGAEGAREVFRVATNVDPSRPGITLARALGDVLRIPFEAGADGLVRVRGVAAAGGSSGRWVVERRPVALDGTPSRSGFERVPDPVDPATVELFAGDAVRVRRASE